MSGNTDGKSGAAPAPAPVPSSSLSLSSDSVMKPVAAPGAGAPADAQGQGSGAKPMDVDSPADAPEGGSKKANSSAQNTKGTAKAGRPKGSSSPGQRATGQKQSKKTQQLQKDGKRPPPPKKPLTAYFLYMQAERPKIVHQMEGNPSIGEVTKQVGAQWRGLSPEEKASWNLQAAEAKKQYALDLQAYVKKYGAASLRDDGNAKSRIYSIQDLARNGDTIIPQTRVKKLVKKDPDVKNISKEALVLLTKCADMFTLEMSLLTQKHASKGNHKGIRYSDVLATVRKTEKLAFMLQDFPDKPTSSSSRSTGRGSKSKSTGSSKKAMSKLFGGAAKTKAKEPAKGKAGGAGKKPAARSNAAQSSQPKKAAAT